MLPRFPPSPRVNVCVFQSPSLVWSTEMRSLSSRLSCSPFNLFLYVYPFSHSILHLFISPGFSPVCYMFLIWSTVMLSLFLTASSRWCCAVLGCASCCRLSQQHRSVPEELPVHLWLSVTTLPRPHIFLQNHWIWNFKFKNILTLSQRALGMG